MKSFPKFFTKQLLLFAALAFLIVIVDFVLYAVIAMHESDTNFSEPSNVVKTVSAELVADEGGGDYVFGNGAARLLDEKGAWAMLIGPDGDIIWKYKIPDEVARRYSINDVALFSHYGYVEDQPSFIWSRDDGLLVVGFPAASYGMFSATGFPREAINRVPLYVLLVLSADLLIFFLAYLFSKRRTVKSIAPLTDALEDLSAGQTVQVNLGGDLKEVGERINEASEIIKKKDDARDSWIRGISHDIRTPLSMITGYADGIANDEEASSRVREDAAIIRAQGLRIKDLVLDLNAASQLEYDMQPLNVEEVHVAGLLREIVAEYLNGGLPEKYELELAIDAQAQDLALVGDRRLLKRAVQNLVQNAMVHNPQGCTIEVGLHARKDGSAEYCSIAVSDTGRGMAVNDLILLQSRILHSIAGPSEKPDGLAGERSQGIHGLGLVLVEKIARAHGGVMQLSGEENKGFVAKLFLPMRHS